MNGWKRIVLGGLGYLLFFVVSLVLFTFLTFDPTMFAPRIERAAKDGGITLQIQKISLKGLGGLEMRGVKVSPAAKPQEGEGEAADPPTPMVIDRLIVKPKLTTLPGLLTAARDNKPPRIEAAFSARVGEGEIESGFLSFYGESLSAEAEAKSFPLARVPLSGFEIKGLKFYAPTLSGSMDAKVKLEMGNRKNPDTWNGDVQLDLKNPGISELKNAIIAFPGPKMQSGNLKAKIDRGLVTVSSLKLVGDDMPMNFTGTIKLNPNFAASMSEINGTIEFSESFKSRLDPTFAQMLPPKKIEYKGPIGKLAAW